jgi:LAS superfamily LD-carboxypeptidase LdcB
MGPEGWRRGLSRGLAAALVAATTLSTTPSGAQEPSTEEQRDEVRDRGDAVAAEIDVLEAEDAEIEAALATIQTEVAGQQVVVNAAEDAQAVADAELADATAAVEDLQAEIAELDAATDQMIIDAFVDPPVNHALDAFRVDTISEATVKDALVSMQADADTTLLEQLDEARGELEVEQANKEDLAAAADQRKSEADAALAELNTALDAQAALATEVEARLNAKLAEAEALRAYDAELSRQIEAEQAALAASLAAAQAQPSPGGSTVTPAPGGLATVTCPGGGSITVAGTIGDSVQALLDAAYADGIVLCGGGYRDPQEQIELRKAHCGTSHYAIYEMPSSQCDPPTARPGTSMHEQGLAIDFTCNGGGALSSGSDCFNWLSANAATYGLYNLPSEPWHWSVNGN